MQYSDDFKRDVLRAFSDADDIREMLDNGSEFLGRILDEARYAEGPSSSAIIRAFETPEEERATALSELYDQAKRHVAICDLYARWSDQYRDQKGLNGRSR